MSSPQFTPGLDRQRFLQRVREGLGPDAGQKPVLPDIDPESVRLCLANESLVEVFTRNAVAAGMNVHRAAESELEECIAKLLTAHNGRYVAITAAQPEIQAALESVAKSRQCRIRAADAPDAVDVLFDVDIGLTDVDAGIAETGSMLMHCGPRRSRLVPLVPPVHIAVLRTSDIVADMVDVWPLVTQRLAEDRSAASILITGPSKTADIEGILVTGVHGPKVVEIVLLG